VKKRQHDGDKNNLTSTLTSGLTRYLAEIRRFPLLTQEEESTYARSWRERGDREAA